MQLIKSKNIELLGNNNFFLIQRGGGTGPMMPGNLKDSTISFKVLIPTNF